MSRWGTLHDAAMMGELAEVKRLMTPDNINSYRPFPLLPLGVCLTPLAEACSFGHTHVARFLLDSGANVKSYPSPITLASEGEFTDTIRLLIERGADPNEPNKRRWTPLHWAGHRGNVEMIEMLLANGADIEAENEDNQRPIHLACDAGRLEAVKLLLQHGCKINAKGEDGATPLHFACTRSPEMVQLLLEHGASLDVEDDDYLTPLDWANRPEIIKILKDQQGKRRRRRRKKEKQKMAKGAIVLRECDTKMVNEDSDEKKSISKKSQKLKKKDPEAQVNTKNVTEGPSLHEAVILGKLEDVRKLTTSDNIDSPKLGDPNKPETGQSPLFLACRFGHKEIVKFLLDSGAKVTHPVRLIMACKTSNFVEIARLLMEKSANVNNAKTNAKQERTPLQEATSRKDAELFNDGAKMEGKKTPKKH